MAIGHSGIKGTTLRRSSKYLSEGSPANLNRVVWFHAVQELSTNWGGGTPLNAKSLMSIPDSSTPRPEVRLRFTDISLLANATSKRYLRLSAQRP